MDTSAADHSDSDSGESWTILEPTPPSNAEDLPVSTEQQPFQPRESPLNVEKDEETDGISIISDSDHESSTPCELTYDYDKCIDENHPNEQIESQYLSASKLQSNNNDIHESMKSDDDILLESCGKHKTYVHRRNKRLSTVLNIIMLGSVITAAGVAIGHMWGAKNDCSLHTTPSVNKILSNLYKMQEENAYLRSKLKELTLANIQGHQRPVSDKIPLKQHRCKKVYEESISNKNMGKPTKCLDNNIEPILNAPMVQAEHEKEFLHDIDKLKQVYQQNKSWLDEEITKRMKREVQSLKTMKHILKDGNLNTVEEEAIDSKDERSKGFMDTVSMTESTGNILSEFEILNDLNVHNDIKQNKISYADSLKNDNRTKKIQKEKISKKINKGSKQSNPKKHRKGEMGENVPVPSSSEYEITKDNRYTAPKIKQEFKKHDRQKSHKKQKRKNKYEKWEMKGEFMNDYDEYSISSSHDNEQIVMKPLYNVLSHKTDNVLNHETVLNDFVANQDIQNIKNLRDKDFKKKLSKNDKHIEKENFKDLDWYEKRSVFRNEARKKMEKELLGETTPNKARWYFRRMRKREQCRAKGDNSTYRKFAKRDMNYKMKH